MGGQAMMTEHGKMMGMGDRCWMMSHMMMDKSLVATEDGGVIVMVGNKLQKYDKDLVLQKEVEIKIALEGMQKTMMEMMVKLPGLSRLPIPEWKIQIQRSHLGIVQFGSYFNQTPDNNFSPLRS